MQVGREYKVECIDDHLVGSVLGWLGKTGLIG